MSFYFEQPIMPTAFNIQQRLEQQGYSACKNNPAFSDENLNLNNQLTETLEFKHLLAKLSAHYCPEVMPLTYYIDSDNFSDVCQHLPSGQHWILKPSLLNNGEGLRLCMTTADVADYFLSNKRFDGPHVLQQYIQPPHLLQGHKYSIRLFVVITNYCGHFLYPEGYFNVAKQAYAANDFTQLKGHLTNEHLTHGDTPDSIQIPTSKAPHFTSVFSALKNITAKILSALTQQHANLLSDDASDVKNLKKLSIFGFDFMLDDNLRAWLLEVNHGPCFPTTAHHILHQHVYNDFWEALVKQFVLPIMNPNTTEPLSMDSKHPFISVQPIK